MECRRIVAFGRREPLAHRQTDLVLGWRIERSIKAMANLGPAVPQDPLSLFDRAELHSLGRRCRQTDRQPVDLPHVEKPKGLAHHVRDAFVFVLILALDFPVLNAHHRFFTLADLGTQSLRLFVGQPQI